MKLTQLILEGITYSNPNFSVEWEEAIRYPEFEEMGKQGWIDIAKKGYVTSYSKIKNVLGNVDLKFDKLNPDKKQRFQDAFKRGTIEMSIAVKFSDNDYDLVAGNTRLSGLVKNGIDPKIWIVDISDLQENYADGKVKEAFSPTPLQNLVNDYLFFITMNFTHLEKTGKSPKDVDALTQMIKQAKVDVDKLKDLSKDQLEKNKNSILQRIHDMLTYIISRMKAHMRPEEYEKRRDRLNKLLALYKDAAKVQENYADGKVKGKSRPGRVKKSGASCKGSVTDLRAKAKKYGGEKGKMYHWCANMKGGKK